MADNVVSVVFNSMRVARTRALWQYDYGILLKFEDLTLPNVYEVEFSMNEKIGETITVLGDSSGVLIPDQFLLNGKDIYAWLFLHTGEDDGEVVYKVTIPVFAKPERSDLEPTPVQQSVIEQAIVLLNTAVDDAEGYASDAETSAQQASASASAAAQSATEAASSASAAALSAQNAAASEAQADAHATAAGVSAEYADESAIIATDAANRAEQAAVNAGYMFFYIDENGDLIYQRTTNTQVDFYLSDGDLYVEASA